jgi:hypothetical protein
MVGFALSTPRSQRDVQSALGALIAVFEIGGSAAVNAQGSSGF